MRKRIILSMVSLVLTFSLVTQISFIANAAPPVAPVQSTKTFEDDFNGVLSKWIDSDGWSTAFEMLRHNYFGSIPTPPPHAEIEYPLIISPADSADGWFAASFVPLNTDYNFGIASRIENDNYYLFKFVDNKIILSKYEDLKWTDLMSQAYYLDVDVAYELCVNASGSSFDLYVNDELVMQAADNSLSSGVFGIWANVSTATDYAYAGPNSGGGEDVPVTSVIINSGTLVSIPARTKQQFTATVEPDDATDKTITWTSSNPNTLTINEKTGLAESIKPGTVMIIAEASNGVMYAILVRVIAS